MTDSSGNSAFTRSITNLIHCVPTLQTLTITTFLLTEDTEGTKFTKCTTRDETVKESMLHPLDNSLLRGGTSTAPTQQHLACVTPDKEKEALITSASVKDSTTGILQPSLSDYLIRQCR